MAGQPTLRQYSRFLQKLLGSALSKLRRMARDSPCGLAQTPHRTWSFTICRFPGWCQKGNKESDCQGHVLRMPFRIIPNQDDSLHTSPVTVCPESLYAGLTPPASRTKTSLVPHFLEIADGRFSVLGPG